MPQEDLYETQFMYEAMRWFVYLEYMIDRYGLSGMNITLVLFTLKVY